jgi:hypothetical protein
MTFILLGSPIAEFQTGKFIIIVLFLQIIPSRGVMFVLGLLFKYLIYLTLVFIGMTWQTLSDGEVIKRFKTFSLAHYMVTLIL